MAGASVLERVQGQEEQEWAEREFREVRDRASTLTKLPTFLKLSTLTTTPEGTIAAEPLFAISTTPPSLLLGEAAERNFDHPSQPPLS